MNGFYYIESLFNIIKKPPCKKNHEKLYHTVKNLTPCIQAIKKTETLSFTQLLKKVIQVKNKDMIAKVFPGCPELMTLCYQNNLLQ